MLGWIVDWLPPLWITVGIMCCVPIVARFFVFALKDLRRSPRQQRLSFRVLTVLGIVGVFVSYDLGRGYRARHWPVELRAREVVRRGDPAVLKLTWGPWPEGVNSSVEMWFRATSLKVGGRDVRPELRGRIREIPNYATQNAFPGYQVVELTPEHLSKLSDGRVPVTCVVEVKTVYHGTALTRRVTLETSFELVPASVETVRVVTTRPAGYEEDKLALAEVRAWEDRSDILVWERRSPRNRYRGLPYRLPEPPAPPTVSDAGELSIRMGERVIPVGLYPQTDRFGVEYVARVPAGEPLPAFVDVILTPNRAAAVRTFDIDTIWGLPIRFLHVPVERFRDGKWEK